MQQKNQTQMKTERGTNSDHRDKQYNQYFTVEKKVNIRTMLQHAHILP